MCIVVFGNYNNNNKTDPSLGLLGHEEDVHRHRASWALGLCYSSLTLCLSFPLCRWMCAPQIRVCGQRSEFLNVSWEMPATTNHLTVFETMPKVILQRKECPAPFNWSINVHKTIWLKWKHSKKLSSRKLIEFNENFPNKSNLSKRENLNESPFADVRDGKFGYFLIDVVARCALLVLLENIPCTCTYFGMVLFTGHILCYIRSFGFSFLIRYLLHSF